jgi:DNA-binding CsgD family transcriptional regulator
VVVVDRSGVVVWMNETARRLMAGRRGPEVEPSGRVSAGAPALTKRLHQAIERAADSSPAGTSCDALALGSGRRPFFVVVAPAHDANQSGAAHRALLFLADAGATPVAWRGLQLLWGLTDREAGVAALLARGLDPRQIAAELDRSYETVRSHLKALRAKTGTKREGQLVRALLLAGMVKI